MEKCHIFLLITGRKWCLSLRKCHYWAAFWQRTGSRRQLVMMQQQKTNCAVSFLHFPPFSQHSAAPIPNPLQVAWTQCKRSTSRTCSSQYGGYKIDANTDRLEVRVSVCTRELASANPFSGHSITGHLFILQRQRNINDFIKVCFPPADCCDQVMWMTTEMFEEKKWLR